MKKRKVGRLKTIGNEFLKEYIIADETKARLKRILVKVLADIDFVCKKYNIFYTGFFGTMLGAARHDGFIPWDDDIDIAVKREDLYKLKNALTNEYQTKYVMTLPGEIKDDPCRQAKIMLAKTKYVEFEYVGMPWDKGFWRGIGIDVFILDNVPNNKIKRAIKKVNNYFLSIAASATMDFKKPSPIFLRLMKESKEFKKYYKKRRILGFFMSFLSTRAWVRLHSKLVSYKKKQNKMVCAFSAYYYTKLFDYNKLVSTKEHKFENINIQIPEDYDEILSVIYGNWRKIPDENKREKHLVYEIDFGDYL